MTRTLLEKCEIPISSEEKTLLQLAASMAVCFHPKSGHLRGKGFHK